MAENEFDQLISQLIDDENPRVRRNAARKLAELRDPSAIPSLVDAFRDDADPAVRAAAEDALRVFRALEQGEEAPSPSRRGPAAAGIRRLRGVMVVLLTITVIANIALLAVRFTQTVDQVMTPQQSTPTARQDLVTAMGARVDALDKAARELRVNLTTFQADLSLNRLPKCAELKESVVTPVQIADIDIRTYPDLGETQALLFPAEQRYAEVRGKYVDDVCKITDLSLLQSRLEQEGGATGLVSQLDEALRTLEAARLRLTRAIESPAPTVGPTNTPTLPPTETPTETPTPGPTNTPDPRATATTIPDALTTPEAGATGDAAATPAPPPTETPTPTNTPEPRLVWQGLRLNTLAAYRYRIDASYEGVTSANQRFSGALQLVAIYRDEPLKARFEVSIRERTPAFFQDEGWLPANLYVSGNSVYTAIDGILYESGDVLVQRRSRARCEAFRLNDANFARFRALNVDSIITRLTTANNLGAENLKFVEQNGTIIRFSGSVEVDAANGVRVATTTEITVDTALQVPTLIAIEEISTPPSGFRSTLVTRRTLTYTLLGAGDAANPDEVIVEAICRNAQPSR